ncbi:MAG: MoxR family ATPase [Gammaproteobacteria bacterium]|nr:MoxR family ATPase [Gammaproteobacteria bacterium]
MSNATPDPIAIQNGLKQHRYLADLPLSVAISCAMDLKRPLLLEGEPGIGKTALANALANVCGTTLIRLQCHNDLSLEDASYEWDTAAQLLAVQAGKTDNIYDREFLLPRPLLRAISEQPAPVLLIDEIDRAEESFEALLLEYLGEWQISIPQYGTVRAEQTPMVILTSNGERSLSDALRRRCLFNHMQFPEDAAVVDIVQMHRPELAPKAAQQIQSLVASLRSKSFEKPPGIAEALDLAAALSHLGYDFFDERKVEQIRQLLPTLVKTTRDWRLVDDATLADLAWSVSLVR